jgi:cytochrome P450
MLWVFPFGRGERTCLAQEIALAYIHLAVGSLLTRCDPHLGDGTELNQDFWFGCMVTKALESHFAANPG